MSATVAYPLQRPDSSATETQTLDFLIKCALLHVRTVHPVKVLAVHGGGVGAIGTVDVQPLVAQLDGIGQSQEHGPVYGRPYLRYQGGNSAIILDPAVGDIGQLQCCDRDISNVVATLSASLPASLRRFNFADGIYTGCIVSAGAPSQYLQFGSSITAETPQVNVSDNLSVANGVSASFATAMGQSVDMIDGVVVSTGSLNEQYFTSLTKQINAATSCADLQAMVTKAFTSILALQSSMTIQQGLLATLQTLVTALSTLGSGYTTGTMLFPIFNQQLTALSTYVSKIAALSSAISSLESAITTAAAKFPSCTISIP